MSVFDVAASGILIVCFYRIVKIGKGLGMQVQGEYAEHPVGLLALHGIVGVDDAVLHGGRKNRGEKRLPRRAL